MSVCTGLFRPLSRVYIGRPLNSLPQPRRLAAAQPAPMSGAAPHLMKGSQEEAQRALLTAGLIMRADRARLCSALLVVSLLHVLVSWMAPSPPSAPGLLP